MRFEGQYTVLGFDIDCMIAICRDILPDAIRGNFIVREHLKDGKLTLFLEPREGKARIGDNYALKVGLFDAGLPETVETIEIKLTIGDVVIVEDKRRNGRKKRVVTKATSPEKGKTLLLMAFPPAFS